MIPMPETFGWPQCRVPETSFDQSCSAPDCTQSIIEVRGLCVHAGGRLLLSDINAQFPQSGVTAIIGPSGAGKSTFLGCLNRLADDIDRLRVTGEITCCGESIYSPAMSLLSLRRKVSMVFQKPTPFPTSIRRNLSLPLLEVRRLGRSDLEMRIEQVLRQVGLWDEIRDRLDSPATTLSGGQQQRLCMARALIVDPVVLLLDEPCSALDPVSTEVFEENIRRIKDRVKVIMVTHNLAQARRLADRLIVFASQRGYGEIVESGDAREVFTKPSHELTRSFFRFESALTE